MVYYIGVHRSHISVCQHTTNDERDRIYGVFKGGGECLNDFDRHPELQNKRNKDFGPKDNMLQQLGM